VKAADITSTFRKHLSFERLLLLLFLAALFVRLYHLDLKLFHHDEAVHAWFSYRLLTEGAYTYDPIYHGPLLYYTTASMFWLFGGSDLVARVVPAVLGALLIPLLYPLKQLGYLSSRQALVAALFIAVSPEMIYFSRFLRNDIFVVFFTLLLLVALLLYLDREKPGYLMLAAAAAGLGMSAKENMPIVLLIFGAYGAYALRRGAIRLPPHWKRDLLLAALVTVGIMALFYSSFGQHPEVLMDGWLRAIEHWTAMHQQERLGGPPYFYLMLLLLYDLPILILAAFATGQFLTAITAGDHDKEERENEGWAAKLKSTAQSLFEKKSPGEGAYGTDDKNREFTLFCIVWMIASLAVYAYIGEKVPWLAIHQLLPLVFVAVYRMSERKTVVAVLSVVFLLGMTWHVAFTTADINEPIVQVQNSEEMREVMALIDASEKVAVITDHYWPLPWYYRGDAGEKISYLTKNRNIDYLTSHDFDLIIAHDQESFASIPGFDKSTFVHSYWFSTNEQRERPLEYYIHRDGEPGTLNWDVFIESAHPAQAS
jgi:uncharacterized protein (TIGR03663 family)